MVVLVEGAGFGFALSWQSGSDKVTMESFSSLEATVGVTPREGPDMLRVTSKGGERVGHCSGEHEHGLPLDGQECRPGRLVFAHEER
jgi:hypothetical protein